MKRFVALLLTLVLAVGVLAGCGGSTSPATADDNAAAPASEGGGDAAAPDALDTSEFVELKMMAVNNAPVNQDWSDEFWEKLNGILKEKLNCTVSYEYIMGNDARNQYNMVLASGEQYDLIDSGALPGYQIPANQGAYKDLTDLLPIYAPGLWEKVPEDRWEEVKVDGKIYGVPVLKREASSSEFMYREDLRVKYNLPEITDMESIGAYLQGIKDNEPGMLPSDDFGAGFYGNTYLASTPFIVVDRIQEGHHNFAVDPKNPREVLVTYNTTYFEDYMRLAKDWADKGYWPSSCLSNTEWGVNSVVSGKAAASFNAIFPWYDWHPPYLERENPGWDIKFFEMTRLNPDAFIAATPAWNRMFSSTRDAANTERALMVLNLIQTDKEVWDLCAYGLEGKNYTLTEDGQIDVTWIDTQTEIFNYFPIDNIKNAEFERTPIDRWDEYDYHMDYILDNAEVSPLAGFALDITPVEAQYTAINQVRVEFGMPLQAGLAGDVDTALADFRQRLDDAGVEEVRVEFERQINEYLDSIGWPA